MVCCWGGLFPIVGNWVTLGGVGQLSCCECMDISLGMLDKSFIVL